MRGYYLVNDNGREYSGCRGGVGSGSPYDDGYEVEIANHRNCSSEMMAFMVHYDEIMEYLKAKDEPIGRMILNSIKSVEANITKGLEVNE